MTQRNYAQSTQVEPGSGAGPPPVFDLAFVSGTQTVSGVTTTDTAFDGNPDIQFTRTIGAGVLADGSNEWYAQVNLIQEVGNAAARFRLQRVNSSGVVQSSSAYSAEQINAGIATLTTTWDSGTWMAGDRLVCSVEFRQNGGHVAAGFNIGRPLTFVDAPDQLPVSGIGIGEASNATSASTDRTVTPPASELLVADILATSGAAIPTPTMSGWGGTWVLERATGSDSDIRRAFRFRCVIASPSAGTPTVDFGATSVGNISIRARAVHDAKNTNNGSDAFLHGSSGSSTLHRNVTTAATRTFLKLQDFADAQNIGLFNAIGGQTEPMTVEGSWIKDFEYHGGIASQVTAFLVGGANEAAINWTNTGHHLMIASEIAVAGSANPASPERVIRLAQGLTNAGSGLWQTASASPAADRLLVFFVQGPNSDVPTPSGWGLTWSQVSPNIGYDTAASPSRRLTAFVAKTGGSSPGADTADVQFAGTPTVVNGSLFEVEGHDLSASALGNIVQAVAEAADAATSISDTMAAFGDVKNGTLIAAISDNATWNYPEVGDGFELLDQDGQGDEPKVGWRYSNDTSPSFDTLQSADIGFLALEIKAATSSVSLSGAGASVSDGRGQINLDRPISGSGPNASDGRGQINLDLPLSGAGPSASDGKGILSPVRGISGAGGNVSLGSGSLNVERTLSGAGGNVNAGQGAIDPIRSLAGNGPNVGSGSGILSIALSLSGSGPSVSDGRGNLTIVGGATELSGSGPNASFGIGILNVNVALAGSGPSAAQGSGDALVIRGLSGAGSNVSSGTSILEAIRNLIGDGPNVSSGSGDLVVQGAATQLSGSGPSASAGSGSLNITRVISGAGASASDGRAVAIIIRNLTGVGSSVSDGFGSMIRSLVLSGSGPNASDGRGQLVVQALYSDDRLAFKGRHGFNFKGRHGFDFKGS